METTPQIAEQLVQRCLRSGEPLLQFSEGTKLGIPGMPAALGGADQRIWLAVTPARVIEVFLKNQSPMSGVWEEMTWMRTFKERRRWYFQWHRQGQPSEYSPIEVPKDFAQTISAIQDGRIATTRLSEESCVPLRFQKAHDDSNVGRVAQAMNLTDIYYECGSCGSGLLFDSDNDTFVRCQGCRRSPDPDQLRDR